MHAIPQWSIAYVYLDPVVGHEQSGNRPALVVSSSDFNAAMDVVTILPITQRKPGRTVYANEVSVLPEESGLPYESIVLAHQVRTISKKRIKNLVSVLASDRIRDACRFALAVHLDLFDITLT